MKLRNIVEQIVKSEPVALIAITDEGDVYNTKVWGRICPNEVVDILRDTVDKMEAKQDETGLPF